MYMCKKLLSKIMHEFMVDHECVATRVRMMLGVCYDSVNPVLPSVIAIMSFSRMISNVG